MPGSRSSRRRFGRARRGRLTALLVLIGIAVVLIVLWKSAPCLLEGYARWLVVQDPVVKSDALVVLSGGDGERLFAAIELYKQGKAGSMLVVGPDVPLLKIYTGEDSLTQGEAKRRIAIRRGIPPESIFLSLGATSTWDEARTALKECHARGWNSIVIVTDPFHTRRARATFRKVFHDSSVAVRTYHLPIGRSSQNPVGWWDRESDALSVITETIKMGFYIHAHHVWP